MPQALGNPGMPDKNILHPFYSSIVEALNMFDDPRFKVTSYSSCILYPFTRSIEQTSSRPDGTPPPGSNVGLGLAHSWSRVI